MALSAWFQHLSHRADRYRWYALGLTTLCQAAANILSAGFGPLAPFLRADFHISRAEVGLITAAMSLTAAPSALFGGLAGGCSATGASKGDGAPCCCLSCC